MGEQGWGQVGQEVIYSFAFDLRVLRPELYAWANARDREDPHAAAARP